MVSGSISLPLQGFFSPFPHGTCSLSVAAEYLALDRGRPGFRQGFSCPAVLRHSAPGSHKFRLRGFHPLWPAFPGPFACRCDFLPCGRSQARPAAPTTPGTQRLEACTLPVWALPRSLAATWGISIDFCSCRYLDGSVPCVSPPGSMYSCSGC